MDRRCWREVCAKEEEAWEISSPSRSQPPPVGSEGEDRGRTAIGRELKAAWRPTMGARRIGAARRSVREASEDDIVKLSGEDDGWLGSEGARWQQANPLSQARVGRQQVQAGGGGLARASIATASWRSPIDIPLRQTDADQGHHNRPAMSKLPLDQTGSAGRQNA